MKQSYFGKLTAKYCHFAFLREFGFRYSIEGGLVFGKNVGINDKLEYKPMKRA